MKAGGRTYYIPFALGSSGVVTNLEVFSTDFHQHDCYVGCLLVVQRTAKTGTATLAAKLQGFHHETETWFDVANSDIVTIADADGAATRYCLIYPGATGSAATGVVVQDVNFNLVNGFLPDTFRVSVTHGGTSISNTFAASLYPLR